MGGFLSMLEGFFAHRDGVYAVVGFVGYVDGGILGDLLSFLVRNFAEDDNYQYFDYWDVLLWRFLYEGLVLWSLFFSLFVW